MRCCLTVVTCGPVLLHHLKLQCEHCGSAYETLLSFRHMDQVTEVGLYQIAQAPHPLVAAVTVGNDGLSRW